MPIMERHGEEMTPKIVTFVCKGKEYRAAVDVHIFRDKVCGIQIAEIRDEQDNVVDESEAMWNAVWAKVNEASNEHSENVRD